MHVRFRNVTRTPLALLCVATLVYLLPFRALPSLDSALSRSSAAQHPLPDVIIYRRTRKTGSSSMLEALLHETARHNYVPLYHAGGRMREVVRAEQLRAHPRRLFVAEHNAVTRAHTGGRRTVILDTVADGYRQMTSHCRYVPKVRVARCDAELGRCLRAVARGARRYRWAGQASEDASTYVDVPLSVAHPALSTSALRWVFPGVVLRVGVRNAVGSACAEKAELRRVYEEEYGELERQVRVLRGRLLVLAGFPMAGGNVSVEEMMEAAEELERERYWREEGVRFGGGEKSRGVSEAHVKLKRSELMWARDESGQVVLRRA